MTRLVTSLHGRSFLLVLLVSLLLLLSTISYRRKVTSAKDKLIIDEAVKQGLTPEFGKILAAQARHETGNYGSYLARFCNNYYGMKFFPGATLHKKRCNGGEYVHYNCLEESVRDVIKWIKRRKIDTKDTDVVAYVLAIKKAGYFTDKTVNYINGVKRAFVKVKV